MHIAYANRKTHTYGGTSMKRQFLTLTTAAAIMALTITLLLVPTSNGVAVACGWGTSGGADYVPQRRAPGDYRAQAGAITQEQAQQLVAAHIGKLNPELKVGTINDAGGFFEAEIVSKDGELLQLLGVDKSSGRLMLLN
jgi:hypothetical protein